MTFTLNKKAIRNARDAGFKCFDADLPPNACLRCRCWGAIEVAVNEFVLCPVCEGSGFNPEAKP